MKILDLRKKSEERFRGENLFEWTLTEKALPSRNWQIGIIIFLISSLIFFLWKRNYFGSILILIIFLILFLPRSEKGTYFAILNEGIRRERELFPYKNLEAFWIFEDPGELYLKTKNSYLPYVVFPVKKGDIEKIRELLSNFLPEEEVERNLLDIVSRKIGM